jgi:hypothetical protein
MAGGHLRVIGALAADGLTDAEATRRVFLTAGGLFLLGLALLIGTVWWWRGTRPEHPVLGPLEVMGERRWAKAPLHERRRMIESVRAARPQPVRGAPASSSTTPSSTPSSSAAAAMSPPASVGAPPAGDGPEPVDLSLLVGSSSTVPEDLAEIDVLLGIVPGHGADSGGRDRVDRESVPVSAEAHGGALAPTAVAADGGRDRRDDGAAHDDLDDEQDRSAIDPLLQRTSAKD